MGANATNEPIKAMLTGQDVTNVYGGVLAAIDLDLQVFESQVQRAQEILASEEKQEQ